MPLWSDWLGLTGKADIVQMVRPIPSNASRACEAVGQRVQKSVFECRVDQLQLETLERNLLDIIDSSQDCLRFYRLTEPVDIHVKEYGNFRAVDFDAPLVV